MEISKGELLPEAKNRGAFISREDFSSLTVYTEAVILSCIIDPEEERDVAVIDIPNAFIQTRVENEKDMVYIRARGVLVVLLIERIRP